MDTRNRSHRVGKAKGCRDMFGNKHQKIEKAIEKKHDKEIIALLADKDDSIVVEALAGLGKCGTDEAFNAIVPFLHNPKKEYRVAAAKALADIGNFHGRAHLSYQIQHETDAGAKADMEAALTRIPEKL